jgi:hypothetical protein
MVKLLVFVSTDPEDLFDPGDTNAREADAGCRPARLHIGFALRERHLRGG